MAKLDADVTDAFGQTYPDEVEMGVKFRRAQANSPPGVNPPVAFEPLTVRKAIVHALTQNYHDEQAGIPAHQKFARGELASKFIVEKEPNVNSDELVTIRELTAKLWTPLIVYQVWTALE